MRIQKATLERLSRGFSTEAAATASTTFAKSFESIPGPKPLPLIGNVWRYLPVIGQYKLDRLYDNAQLNRELYGPIVRELITPDHTILHLFDPNDIETLFRLDGHCPHRRSHRALLKYRHDRSSLYTDGGLFPENGPNWQRQRKQFQTRLMSKQQVSLDTGKIDRCVRECLINRLSPTNDGDNTSVKSIPSLDTLLNEWAFASSLAVFLDTTLGELDREEIRTTVEQLHNSLLAIDGTELHSDKWIKSAHKCKYYRLLIESQEHLHNFVSKRLQLIEDRSSVKQHQHQQQQPHHSFIEDWLLADKIDRKDVISFVIDALMAGYHTTTFTAAHLLYYLSLDSELREQLRTQLPVPIVAGNSSSKRQQLDAATVDSLDLLDRCLKETMRLNPVSIGTGRVVQNDDAIIRGYSVPRGTMVIAHTQCISRDPKIFDEPDKFEPDRWVLYRTLKRTERPSAFANLPFGFGARSCIGQRVASMQIKVLAVRLIEHFDIEFGEQIQTKTTLIHNISKPIEVTVRRRQPRGSYD